MKRFLTFALLASAVIALVFHRPIAEHFGQMQWEDKDFLLHNRLYIHSIRECFESDENWRGLYRPLSTNLYFHTVGQLGLPACHVLSVALYGANVLLAYWVCLSFWTEGPALAAALLFGTRLANTETMLYMSQMQTLLPVTFSLLALKAYLEGLKGRVALLVASTVFVFLGLLSKETVVVLPAICLMLGYALAPRFSPLMGLPVLALAPWYAMAHSFWKLNLYWTYDFSPMAIAGNFVAYLCSYSDLMVCPVRLVDPVVILNAYPAIMWAQRNEMLRVAFWMVAALSAWTIWKRGRLLWLALGFGIFVAALAPVVIVKDQLFMFYGYFGHFGLSIAIVGTARSALTTYGKSR